MTRRVRQRLALALAWGWVAAIVVVGAVAEVVWGDDGWEPEGD